MIRKNRSIIVNCKNFTGIIFYAFEYYIYLNENNYNIELIFVNCSSTFHTQLFKVFQDKYKPEYFKRLMDKNITFIKNIPIIFSNILLVLDYSTYEIINTKLLYKKCFYNFTNEFKSTTRTFHEFSKFKNIIDFGDKNIGCKTDNHYPLKLNFKMFKEISYFDNTVLIENKIKLNKQKPNTKDLNYSRVFKGKFHESFSKVVITKVNYDRANRLIPECKFYNKEIYINKSNYPYDSVDDRFLKPYQEFDINNQNNFITFLKENE